MQHLTAWDTERASGSGLVRSPWRIALWGSASHGWKSGQAGLALVGRRRVIHDPVKERLYSALFSRRSSVVGPQVFR